jgi:Uma2 family endonuclease
MAKSMHMTARREATIENLERVPGKAEIVNGRIVRMTAASSLHGYVVGRIFVSLEEYERRTGFGHAFGDNVGFIVNLPNRWSFCPDAAFYTGKLTQDFAEGAPIFAVEVRSKKEYGPKAEAAMAAKRADYFAAGTVVVWDVDVLREGWVRVYRATNPDQPTLYRRGDRAEAEPALPGWSFSVSDLFPPQ